MTEVCREYGFSQTIFGVGVMVKDLHSSLLVIKIFMGKKL